MRKMWRAAILQAVAVQPDGKDRLREIAEVTVLMALRGDMDAIKEIGNRIDGKPRQEFIANVSRAVCDIPDDELAAIATGRSEGTLDPAEGTPGPDNVH